MISQRRIKEGREIFVDIKRDKKVVGLKFIELSNHGEIKCVAHCTFDDDCYSVNYHTDDQRCVVIKEVLPFQITSSHLVDGNGWNFMEKSKLKVIHLHLRKNSSEIGSCK